MIDTSQLLFFSLMSLHLKTSTSQVNWNKQYNRQEDRKRTIHCATKIDFLNQTPLVFVAIIAPWTFASKYSLTTLGDLLNLNFEQVFKAEKMHERNCIVYAKSLFWALTWVDTPFIIQSSIPAVLKL